MRLKAIDNRVPAGQSPTWFWRNTCPCKVTTKGTTSPDLSRTEVRRNLGTVKGAMVPISVSVSFAGGTVRVADTLTVAVAAVKTWVTWTGKKDAELRREHGRLKCGFGDGAGPLLGHRV